MTLLDHLRDLFRPVLAGLAPTPEKLADYLEMVKPSSDAKNGDYQANFAMPLAKVLSKKPPELAKEIVSALPQNELIESAAVAGPGFINVKLKTDWLAKRVASLSNDPRLGVRASANPKTFVIDLSAPNVAKPLHVGHLRSTIIGDALVRLLRFLGHTVVGDNHVGDWGTQFGILIYGYKHYRDEAAYATDPVRELARLYIHVRNLAKVVGDEDEGTGDVMEECRKETAKLHAGDPENVSLWKQFMPACLAMLQPIYDRLDVKIDHTLGESFYNPMLPGIVEELLKKGIAVESNGAVVIPNAKGIVPSEDEMTTEEPPALIRKRDGAFTYTTTDLATIKYRVDTWKPNSILYVVDARQALHFKSLFANATRWGFSNVEFKHISFGSILGEDRKPFAARKGGAPELSELIGEAIAKGLERYEASYADRKSFGHEVPELSEDVKSDIAQVIGIGALKYADLSGNRTSDYCFSFDKMLATEGNTGTYMQYAYARCRSILRKSEVKEAVLRTSSPAVSLDNPMERALALQLLRFPEALQSAATDYLPHVITAYLWELAKSFSSFFEACPVLKAESESLKMSRLLLVDLVGRTIRQSLDLLGIRTVERM